MEATRGALSSVIIQSSSQVVGENNADFTVTVRTSNPVPQNGRLAVDFPFWNPEAQGTIFRLYSYLQTPTSVQCVPRSTNILKSSFTCTFDAVNQILTLSNCFTTFVPAGTEISFIIKNMRNPVSTQPVTDIQVFTIDDTTKRGVIDWAQGTLSVS